MKKNILFAAGMAVLLALTGCQGAGSSVPPKASAPEPAESGGCDGYIEQSANYLSQFQQGQYADFYQAASASLKEQLPEETFAAQWAAILQAAGPQEELLSRERTERDGHQIVTITARHTLRKLVSTFSYDKENVIVGVYNSFQPLDVVPETTDFWTEEPVKVGKGEKKLQGLLTLPKGVEKPPVLLLIQGSGPSDLDEKIGLGGNRPFRDLAHGLAERGIATLRYNKRSYEFPEDCAVSGIEAEYLDDAGAATALLAADERLGTVYLLGHSEGGMLGPEIIRQNSQIEGFISMAGTLRPLIDLLIEQAERQLSHETALTGPQKEAALAVYRQAAEQIKALGPDDTEEILGASAVYWRSLNALNLPALAEELTVPVLILQGEEDFQVPASVDMPLWQAALSGNPDVSFRLYPGLSHLFMPGGSADTIDLTVYNTPSAVDPQVISDIADWVLSH